MSVHKAFLTAGHPRERNKPPWGCLQVVSDGAGVHGALKALGAPGTMQRQAGLFTPREGFAFVIVKLSGLFVMGGSAV